MNALAAFVVVLPNYFHLPDINSKRSHEIARTYPQACSMPIYSDSLPYLDGLPWLANTAPRYPVPATT